MHLRTHLWTSAVTGLLCYPRSPAKAALVLASGVLIDVDHIVLYMLQTGDYSIVGALVYDRYRNRPSRPGDTRPRYGSLRSWVHHPIMLPILAWVIAKVPLLRPIAIGLLLHLTLDHMFDPLLWPVYWRAKGRCELCGTETKKTRIHYIVHPVDGGTWKPNNMVVLCRSCHRKAAAAYPAYPPV